VKTCASFANGPRRLLFDNMLLETTDAAKRMAIRVAAYSLSCVVQLGMVPILVLVLLLLFKWQSSRLIKKNRLVRFPVESIPALPEFVTSIWEMHGLPPHRMPRLYWQPFNKDVNAFVFGGPGNRAIALTAGLLLDTFRGDGRKASAILSHEFGHIHNRDVTYFYLMQVLIVLLTLSFALIDVPAVIWMLVDPDFFIHSELQTAFAVRHGLGPFGVRVDAFLETFEMLLILAVMTLAMRYVIREREYYADARAIERGASATDLEEILTERGAAPSSLSRSLTLGPIGLRRIQRALGFHPDSRARARMLRHPLRLIYPTLSYSFVTGFLGAIQIHRMDKFGLPQAVGLIGILCALWSLILDSQAGAIAYRLSPGRGALVKALLKLTMLAVVFAAGSALGTAAEGTSEILVQYGIPGVITEHGIAIGTLVSSLFVLTIFGAEATLFSVIFGYTSLVTFAATLMLRMRGKARGGDSVAFDRGIPLYGTICCIVFAAAVVLTTALIVRSRTDAQDLPLGVLWAVVPAALWGLGTFLASIIRLGVEFIAPSARFLEPSPGAGSQLASGHSPTPSQAGIHCLGHDAPAGEGPEDLKSGPIRTASARE
jgi:Zn-dependent protease with chaperone function